MKKSYRSVVSVIRELTRLKARRETTREVLILCIMYGSMHSSSLARDRPQTRNTNVNLRSFQVGKFISGHMPCRDFSFQLIATHLHFCLNPSSCPPKIYRRNNKIPENSNFAKQLRNSTKIQIYSKMKNKSNLKMRFYFNTVMI